MSTITIIAFPTAPASKEHELAAQFDKLVPATRAEPGCLGFTVHQHPQIANRFAVYEKFRDQAAFDAHLQYAHTKAFVEWIQASGSVLHFERWDEKPQP
ncbi:Antibiotic biosynthesis monooxygenase (plasmid) [Rahnella aceris]|jgi:quinol monooxygenase YgiN|uniref:Antibiotic biosynthesis monooxygenase n=1 Tax=Rahnella sp. (strain Y9602) TaxID=2703885 RepID=A0A0H3FKB0_RAHSY|nr:putative quinol monooxygenase [Rahnella aceris]ADW76741.1 Antibiotic biosynthesis monooxygenase [Rahnella aceris]MDP9707523.1 quinol monooxygenase YgiN [Rahnella aquatilis]